MAAVKIAIKLKNLRYSLKCKARLIIILDFPYRFARKIQFRNAKEKFRKTFSYNKNYLDRKFSKVQMFPKLRRLAN